MSEDTSIVKTYLKSLYSQNGESETHTFSLNVKSESHENPCFKTESPENQPSLQSETGILENPDIPDACYNDDILYGSFISTSDCSTIQKAPS